MSSYFSLPELASSIWAKNHYINNHALSLRDSGAAPRCSPVWRSVRVLVDNPGFKSWLRLYHFVTLACKVQGKAIVSWVYFYCTKHWMELNYFFHLPTILTNWTLWSQESRFPNVNQTLELGISRNIEKSWRNCWFWGLVLISRVWPGFRRKPNPLLHIHFFGFLECLKFSRH